MLFRSKLDENITPTSVDGSITLDITGIGAMRMQIGANESQIIELRIPSITLEAMGIETIDITTQESAKAAIDQFSQ